MVDFLGGLVFICVHFIVFTILQIIRCDPPQWTINAPAQTNHRTEPIFCMDTPLGTTAGYSGAIFEI